jgi:hypothetical protein
VVAWPPAPGRAGRPRGRVTGERPALVRVAADGPLTAYALAEVLAQMAAGHSRDLACEAGSEMFSAVMMAASGLTVAEPANVVRTPARCMAEVAASCRDTLRTPWPGIVAAYGRYHPCLLLPGEDVETLAWLADAARRVAEGVPLGAAGRQAADAAAGRSRRRRPPADPAWLAGAVWDAQAAAWAELAGQQPFAARGALTLPAVPPRVVIDRAFRRRFDRKTARAWPGPRPARRG